MADEPEEPEEPDAGASRPPAGDQPRIKPAQIPLLDDVFEAAKNRQKRRLKREKENLDLPLDPLPPRTPDLFEDPPWSAAAYVATITGAGDAGDARGDQEQLLRDHAGEMIDSLVQEYSREIVRRLREELTTLLDELEQETPRGKAPGKRDDPPPSPPTDATDPT